jgi:hypothetical protein
VDYDPHIYVESFENGLLKVRAGTLNGTDIHLQGRVTEGVFTPGEIIGEMMGGGLRFYNPILFVDTVRTQYTSPSVTPVSSSKSGLLKTVSVHKRHSKTRKKKKK